ncbi:hypothetical protein ACFLYB_01425 [Chloroflexota bacterium]
MENTIKLLNILDSLACEVGELNKTFSELDQQLSNVSRAEELSVLKNRLMEEVKRIQDIEADAEYSFNYRKVFSGAFGALAAGIVAHITKKEHPLQAAYDSYAQGLQKVCYFGKVMVVLKEKAKPGNAEVISISGLAREANTTEANIMSSFKSKGFSIMSPEELWKYLDRLKEEITGYLSKDSK